MPEREYYLAGGDLGRSRASWVFDGNTDIATYRRVLVGLDDLDPEVLEAITPPQPLSGEMAGESMTELLGEDYTDEDADEFEEGYYDAFYHEVERVARYHLEGT